MGSDDVGVIQSTEAPKHPLQRTLAEQPPTRANTTLRRNFSPLRSFRSFRF